jgi:hypothetical protein
MTTDAASSDCTSFVFSREDRLGCDKAAATAADILLAAFLRFSICRLLLCSLFGGQLGGRSVVPELVGKRPLHQIDRLPLVVVRRP